MAFMDKVKQMMGKHDSKVDRGLGKAGDAAKRKSPGHDGPIDKVVRKAQDSTGPGDGPTRR